MAGADSLMLPGTEVFASKARSGWSAADAPQTRRLEVQLLPFRVGDSMATPLLMLALTLLPAGAALAGGPLRIGSEKQLFVGPFDENGRDAYLVESMKNVEMTMNPARVTGERLVENDRPWEGAGMLDMRQCVIKDGDLFRMYYNALPHMVVSPDPDDPRKNIWGRSYNRILCYAESGDGIHWTKPDLGICEWNGSRNNNILLPNPELEYAFSELDGPAVFIDPVAKSRDTKYKMIVKISPAHDGGAAERAPVSYAREKKLPKGQYLFGSPDGIHWRLLSDRSMSRGACDTQYSVFWDERISKYVAYTRMKPKTAGAAEYWQEAFGVPGRAADLSVGRQTSDDFLHWSDETLVLRPDKIDLAGCPRGLTRLDFYGGNVSKYARNIYIGLPNAYYHWKIDPERRWWNRDWMTEPSTMDVQLITSRDGIHFHRSPQRRPFIGLGPQGTFWSGQIYPDGNAIRVGDELWFYFAGLDVHHKEQYQKVSHGARGRAVLRLDGFISADAAYTGGELTTVPLVFEGHRLQLNVDTSAGGTVRVEIQDADGTPLKGFSEEDADEINGNYIRKVVTWNGNCDVAALSGKPIRLRFLMRDTKLYSFQFRNESAHSSLQPATGAGK